MTDSSSTILEDVATSLDIPEDGVLSKVLYRDDKVRVVGFAFDTDQELTEHTAAVPVVIQVVSGRFQFTVGDKTSEIGPVSWIHLEASVPHSVLALEPSRLLLTLLS
ncbi:MAG: cupin domain-containing protein [Acidimicrobiia bacterium]